MIRDAEYKAWLNQQQEIKHQEEVIAKLKSFNREKSIKRAESREKMLDKIDVLDKPVEENVEMHLELKPRVVSGNDVLTVKIWRKHFLSRSCSPTWIFCETGRTCCDYRRQWNR